MKKSSTRRKIFKIFLKAIFLLLTSLIYILIIQSESKNLLTFRIGAKKPAIEVKYQNVTQSPTKKPQKVVDIVQIITTKRTESSTPNSIYEYSQELNELVENDMRKRKEHLMAACERHHLTNVLKPNSLEFIISHDLAWCTIFKSASTYLLRLMNILAGYDVNYLKRTVAVPISLARKRFPRPSLEELNDALETSISFLSVREPFERLLSAYRNKIENGKNAFYKQVGDAIIKQFRTKSEKNGTYIGPTFSEFLQHIVFQSKVRNKFKTFDEHWSPYWKFCTPCSINYTVIIKLETFQRDLDYIIRSAGLESLLIDKIPKSELNKVTNRAASDTNALLPRYFSQIDEKLLKEILEIYQIDFDLFNYESGHYFDIVKKLN